MALSLPEATGLGRLLIEHRFAVPNQKAQYFLRQLEIEAPRVSRGEMSGELEPSSLTVEHILPKNPGAEWEAVLANDPNVAIDCTHRLGNLCLLTEVNRRLGREPFDTKKQTYAKASFSALERLRPAVIGDAGK
jgi:hypothetical protein